MERENAPYLVEIKKYYESIFNKFKNIEIKDENEIQIMNLQLTDTEVNLLNLTFDEFINEDSDKIVEEVNAGSSYKTLKELRELLIPQEKRG